MTSRIRYGRFLAFFVGIIIASLPWMFILVTKGDPCSFTSGGVTQFFYNAIGKIIKTQYPDGTAEETILGPTGNAIGLPIKVIDRNNIITELQYDAAERLVARVHASAIKQGNTEVATPDVAMTESWVYLNGTDDPIEHNVAGSKTKFVYDYRGRRIQTTVYPRANVELMSSNSYVDNRLFSSQDPYGRKSFYGYDVTNGRMIRQVIGTVPSYSLANFAAVMAAVRNQSPNATFLVNDSVYDSAGRLESRFDPRGIETRFEYDSRNRMTNQRAAYGTSIETRTETVLDAVGNTTEVRSPRYFDSSDTDGYQKAREQWTYNGRGRVATHVVSPGTADGAIEYFTYDLKGRQLTHTDFASNVWTTVYDTCCDISVASKDPLGKGKGVRYRFS